ncbi:MAG: glycosyltransferase [Rudanella sp.]|nr:glycosyltransferase [Rudanella sp.]
MRILLVHNILWAHYKAAVFQAIDQLVGQRSGVSFRVLQIGRNERLRGSWETNDPNAPTYAYPYELLFDSFVEDIPLGARTRALLSRMRRYKPDVLCLTGYYDPAQLALLAYARLTGVPVVMQMESTALDNDRSFVKEQVKQFIIRQCNGFFCFGSPQADYLNQLGVSPARILLQKSAVDNQALLRAYQLAIQERETRQQALRLPAHNFIFVGRLIEPKNLPMLLRCFADAVSQSPNKANWGLILLGDGPQEVALKQQVQELALETQVFFRPATPWYQVPDVLALADVLVLPSVSEPWGLVVNEAMVCGLPVLVSDRCGCAKDLVRDGQNGYLFDPGQPAQLTGRLLAFMNEQADRGQMGQESQGIIQSWSVSSVAAEMLAGFNAVKKT